MGPVWRSLPAPRTPRAHAVGVHHQILAPPLGRRPPPGDGLVFGKGNTRPADSLVHDFARDDRALCLPMLEGERSLNVATAVCASSSKLRQCARGEIAIDANGRYTLG